MLLWTTVLITILSESSGSGRTFSTSSGRNQVLVNPQLPRKTKSGVIAIKKGVKSRIINLLTLVCIRISFRLTDLPSSFENFYENLRRIFLRTYLTLGKQVISFNGQISLIGIRKIHNGTPLQAYQHNQYTSFCRVKFYGIHRSMNNQNLSPQFLDD